MNMIEKVARALAKIYAMTQPWTTEVFDKWVDEHWKYYKVEAVKAIEAMREEDLKLELSFRKFMGKVDKNIDDCWWWKGCIDKRDGYGRFYSGQDFPNTAYGFAYLYFKGVVPKGLVIDHTCRNRACVNPDHLRVVTNKENVLCGEGLTAKFARATKCGRGHEMNEENTYIRPDGHRSCKECQRTRSRDYKSNKKQQ